MAGLDTGLVCDIELQSGHARLGQLGQHGRVAGRSDDMQAWRGVSDF